MPTITPQMKITSRPFLITWAGLSVLMAAWGYRDAVAEEQNLFAYFPLTAVFGFLVTCVVWFLGPEFAAAWRKWFA